MFGAYTTVFHVVYRCVELTTEKLQLSTVVLVFLNYLLAFLPAASQLSIFLFLFVQR